MDENRDDQPLSSEELLRRAREGLGESPSPPEQPADFKIESYPPPVAEPEPTFEPEVPSYDAPDSFGDIVGETPSGPFEPDPPVFDLPAEGSDSWAPPPGDAADSDWQASAPGPAPTEVRRSGGGIASKLWIVVVLVIGGFALFSFLDGSKTVDQIAVGDCLNTPEDDIFYEIDPIDCTEEHDLEVFALVDLSTVSSEFSVSAGYPGDDAVYEAAIDECLDEFERFVGVPYADSVLFLDAFTPTLEGWEEVDDRIANCVVFEVNASQTEIVKSTFSLRNANR
ncbi:MAG: septum formation family protein [Acidimicrobiia bacterium]|nr:septum formation family protein [Acidimicrobiia bacterium]